VHSPDGAVVAAGDSQRLFRMNVERPELALAVSLHDEQRFVAVPHHHLHTFTHRCSQKHIFSQIFIRLRPAYEVVFATHSLVNVCSLATSVGVDQS